MRVSLCSFGCPGTCSVDQAGLKFKRVRCLLKDLFSLVSECFACVYVSLCTTMCIPSACWGQAGQRCWINFYDFWLSWFWRICFVFEIGFHLSQASLQLFIQPRKILNSRFSGLPPKCWDCRCASLCSVYSVCEQT